MRLLVIGGIALDYLCKVKDVDSKVTQVLQYSENLGGMAYNTAFAAAQLGVGTTLVSAVGKDFPKQPRTKNLAYALTKTSGQTTRSFLFYDGRDERICFFRGAYHDMDVKRAKAEIKKADWAHFAGVAPCFSELARFAAKEGKVMSCNLGYDLFHYPAEDRLISDLLSSSDYIITNSKELDYLGRQPEDLAKKATIVTMGKDGSRIFSNTGEIRVPAFNTNVKSPFGAGDAYTGTLIAALLNGKNLKKSAYLASAAGSFTVEEKSTTPKLSWVKLERRAATLG